MRMQAMEDAIWDGKLAKVQLLLEAGVPADGGTNSPFIDLALHRGQLEIAEMLCASGARPTLPRMLYWAVEQPGDLTWIHWLLDLEPRSTAELDQAYEYASLAQHELACALLLERGASPPPDPLGALRSLLEPARRSAWVPEIVAGADDVMGCKFAGVPRLTGTDPWPRCGYCDQPLQLLLQLDLAQTPLTGTCGPDGLLQIVYCCVPDTYCEQAGDDAFSPFGRFLAARVRPIAPQAPQTVTEDLSPTAFAPSRIAGWSEITDLPSPEEPARNTGVVLAAEQIDAYTAAHDALERRGEVLTRAGDKLLGWPVWVQGYAPVPCPDCGEEMVVLAQIASNDSLPFVFGDAGVAQITRCERHPDRVGFAWAGS